MGLIVEIISLVVADGFPNVPKLSSPGEFPRLNATFSAVASSEDFVEELVSIGFADEARSAFYIL